MPPPITTTSNLRTSELVIRVTFMSHAVTTSVVSPHLSPRRCRTWRSGKKKKSLPATQGPEIVPHQKHSVIEGLVVYDYTCKNTISSRKQQSPHNPLCHRFRM